MPEDFPRHRVALAMTAILALTFVSACRRSTGGSSPLLDRTAANTQWTDDAASQWSRRGRCLASAFLAQGYNPDFLPTQKAYMKDRVAAGWALLTAADRETDRRQDRSLLSRWARALPRTVSRFVDLEKYYYPLFMSVERAALDVVDPAKAPEQVLALAFGPDDVWVDSFYAFYKGMAFYDVLTPTESLAHLARFNLMDPYRTFGQMAWTTFRDLKLVDEAGLSRDTATRATRFMLPPLLEQSDPRGQVYHFMGYAARRLGEGAVVGGRAASAMSIYYERYKQDDQQDYFADHAGIAFAEGFEIALNDAAKSGVAARSGDEDAALCAREFTFGPPASQDRGDKIARRDSPAWNCVVVPGVAKYGQPTTWHDSGRRNFRFHGVDASMARRDEVTAKCRAYAFLGFTSFVPATDTKAYQLSAAGKMAYRRPDAVRYQVIHVEGPTEDVAASGVLTLADLRPSVR